MAGSTPTVLNTRRVTELKNVSASSASGRADVRRRVLRPHGGPDRPLHHRVFQDVVDVGHRGVDVRLVERQPLRGVGLGPGPVPPLETAPRPAGDLLEAALVLLVGRVDRGDGGRDRTKGRIAVHSVTRSNSAAKHPCHSEPYARGTRHVSHAPARR